MGYRRLDLREEAIGFNREKACEAFALLEEAGLTRSQVERFVNEVYCWECASCHRIWSDGDDSSTARDGTRMEGLPRWEPCTDRSRRLREGAVIDSKKPWRQHLPIFALDDAWDCSKHYCPQCYPDALRSAVTHAVVLLGRKPLNHFLYALSLSIESWIKQGRSPSRYIGIVNEFFQQLPRKGNKHALILLTKMLHTLGAF